MAGLALAGRDGARAAIGPAQHRGGRRAMRIEAEQAVPEAADSHAENARVGRGLQHLVDGFDHAARQLLGIDLGHAGGIGAQQVGTLRGRPMGHAREVE